MAKNWNREIPPSQVMFGRSSVMSRIREIVDCIAPVSIPVLIHGATGTGKEVLANYIHQASKRQGAFLKVNCAAIPATLLEAELFGVEKGAFTGAATSKAGMLEHADQGTLLLDDIAELDWNLQSKLLQFLQDGTFTRLGGCEERRVHTRVISTCSHSPEEYIAAGRLRQDLFHRLSGATVGMPLLRERMEDIPLITDYLLVSLAAAFATQVRSLSTVDQRRLARHSWPGNIRELENVLRRYALLGTSAALFDAMHFRPPATSLWPDPPVDSSLKTQTRNRIQRAEAIAILQVLQMHGWNRSKSAESLNISIRALLYKMRSAGIFNYVPTGGREN